MVSAEVLQDRLSEECVDALLGLTNKDTGVKLPRKNFGWGKTILKEGEQGSNMYVVISGQVGITRMGRDVAELSGKGAFFGEMAALFDEAMRTATVTSRIVRVLELSTADVAGLTLFDKDPLTTAAKTILQTATIRINGSVRNLSVKQVEELGIPPVSSWMQTESGFKYPPLRVVKPTKFQSI